MNIHQLSVNYLQEQDRILLRINTSAGEELRLWLTRRLTLNLWPMLTKIVADQVVQQARSVLWQVSGSSATEDIVSSC